MSEKKFEPRSQSQSDAATESFTARARDTQPEARRESGSETEGDSRTYRHSQSEVKLESQSLIDISQGQCQRHTVWTSCQRDTIRHPQKWRLRDRRSQKETEGDRRRC